MKAAIYVRVSTDHQAEKGYSIDTQLAACRKYASVLGATNIEEFVDDGYSAEFIDRPELTRLRESLKTKKFDKVIFYDPDRMARNLMHQLIIAEEIDKAGAELCFVVVNYDQSPDGRFMFGIRGLLAELEKEKIKERTMRGKKGKAAKGMVIRDAKPIGYTFDRDKSTYHINENEAQIVVMIYDFLVKDKMGTSRICKELNARGIPSPRSKKTWAISTVYRILTNTIYKGVIFSMKYKYETISLTKRKRSLRPEIEWIPVMVPPIISEVIWQAAQNQLQENKSSAKRNLKRDYLLKNQVVCAKCGRAMVITHSGSSDPVTYYTCASRKASSICTLGKECCNSRLIPTKLLDNHIFTYLFDLYYSPEKTSEQIYALMSNGDENQYELVLKQMKDAKEKLMKQKATILRWFRQSILSENEIESHLEEIASQLAENNAIQHLYEEKLATLFPDCSKVDIVTEILEHMKSKSFTTNEKIKALQSLVDKVIVERIDHTRGRGSCPKILVKVVLK